MTTIGAIGSSYVYPAGVRRFGDGSVAPTPELKNEDEYAWAQAVADSYNRSPVKVQKTAEDVLKEWHEREVRDLHNAQTMEAFLAGKLQPLAGTPPEVAANAIAQAREARSQHYTYVSGPVSIEAMNVNSAVNAQTALTGGDLTNLAQYGDYLRGEVAAATKARPDVTFTGTWGKDRVTNDVNEYVGWLMQAIQQKSRQESNGAQA